MPFGKYKGLDLKYLPFEYVEWLSSIELKDPLKSHIRLITEDIDFRKYLADKGFQDETN